MDDRPELEILRRQSRILLDREGRWRHEGEPIQNQRIASLFDRSFRVDENGELRLELGREWCFVEIEDTAYFVRRARDTQEGGLVLALNDGSEEALDPASLALGGDTDLYCRVKEGRHPARFLRAAYHHVLHRLDVDDEGRVVWRQGADRVPVVRIEAPVATSE